MIEAAKLRRWGLLLAKYFFGFAILWWVIHSSQDFEFSSIQKILLSKVVFALILLKTANVFLVFFRWKWILRALQIPLSFSGLLRISFIGLTLNYALPGSISGDIVKGALLRKQGGSTDKIAFSLFFDRAFGLLCILIMLVCLCAYLLIFDPQKLTSFEFKHPAFGEVTVALALLGLMLFSTFVYWKRHLVKKIIDRLLYFVSHFRSVQFWLVLSVLSMTSQLCIVFFIYLISQNSEFDFITVASCFFTFSFFSFASVLPITPGNVGVGQAVYKFLFDAYTGIKSPAGMVIFSLVQIFDLIYVFIGALYLLRDLLLKKQHPPGAP